MADTRLRETTRPAHPISEWAYRLMVGIEEFFEQWLARREAARAAHWAAQPDIVKRRLLARELGCSCDGTCKRCQHLIRDIWPQ